MVVWKAEHAAEIFNRVKEEALSDACTVLILSQPSADSICAGLIIQSLLRKDQLKYSQKVVSSYSHLMRIHAEDVVPNDEVRHASPGAVRDGLAAGSVLWPPDE